MKTNIEKFKDKYISDPDRNLTLSEKELKKREELEREEWELEEIDSPHGDEFVIKTEQAKEKKAKSLQDDLLNFLDEDRNYISYRERLAAIGEMKLKSIEFVKGWEYYCRSTEANQRIKVFGKSFDTKPGIIVIIKDPLNKTYIGAMGVTYDPVIDHGAITTLVIQAENTYDKVRGYSLSDIQIPVGNKDFTKDKSGIYVPNKVA